MKKNTDLIDVNLAPEKYEIDLEKKHFEKSYAIFILELTHKKNKYYYIEHLIDSKGISVKYSFARLAYLFEEKNSSTHNQIFKFILNQIIEIDRDPERKITDKHKTLVQNFLTESKIKFHVYPVLKFDYNTLKKKTHKENTKKVKNFEQQVIRLFDTHSKQLINDKISNNYVRYDDILFPKTWHLIKIDFYI